MRGNGLISSRLTPWERLRAYLRSASLGRARCRRRLRRTRNRIGSTSAEQPSLETDSSVRRDSSIPAAEGQASPWQCVSESITWYSVSSSTDQIETLGVRRDPWQECSGGGF